MSRRTRHNKIELVPPGQRFTLTLTDMGHNGVALGRHEEQVILVPYGIPGETVEVEVTRKHKDYLEAEIVSVLSPSSDRTEPPCPYYGECGGCQWQHIAYPRQLDLKRQVVLDQLRRIGKFTDAPVEPTLTAPSPFRYRNHARFTINKEGGMGFVRRGTHRVIPLDECLLLDDGINGLMNQLRGHCAETRQLSVRYGSHTGDWLVQPKIKNPDLALETGQQSYNEEMSGHSFRVASPSFFQVNTAQAERLVEVVRGYLAPTGSEVLVDAYAGVGTFAVLLADYVGKVIAIEESGPAVRDGRINAQQSPNVEYLQGKVEELLPALEERPHAVLLDPPRAGCHADTMRALLDFRPQKLVYVSCEPATLARDLRILCDGGFRLITVQPVDLFPQTYHIEAVALLEPQE